MIADISDGDPTLGVLQGVKKIVTVGSQFPKRLLRLINEKHDIEVINRFGATESTKSAENLMSLEDDSSFVGTLFDDVEIKVVDENFAELPVGEIGRIGLRSPRTRRGYKNNPEATAKHFIDGFFFSGDEGYVTQDRKLHLVGRTDERINAGGRKIDPALIDGELRGFKGIIDAAVFSYEKDSGIRGLAAALVLRSGVNLNELIKQIGPVLGSKNPDVFIAVTGIPRNAMGKAMRLDLERNLEAKARQLTPKLRMRHEE
jgi:acyl-coenzyme A synthetase/AMP-(fatty) acid ligase